MPLRRWSFRIPARFTELAPVPHRRRRKHHKRKSGATPPAPTGYGRVPYGTSAYGG